MLKTVSVELRIRARYPTPIAVTKAKIQLEHKEALVEIAGQIGIAHSIHLGIGERKQGVVEKGPDILAETMKAIIGAVYLDGGFEPAREAIIGCLATGSGRTWMNNSRGTFFFGIFPAKKESGS